MLVALYNIRTLVKFAKTYRSLETRTLSKKYLDRVYCFFGEVLTNMIKEKGEK